MWIFFSLLAPLLFTIVIFIDKYIIEQKVKDGRGVPIYTAIAALIIGSAVWIIGGLPVFSLRNGLLVLFAGMIDVFASALYFYGLIRSHTSYIVALLQVTPVFILILSLVAFGNTLNWQQLVGFFLVFGSVISLSINRVERRPKFDRAFWAVMAADILFATAAIVVKFTVNLTGFAGIVAYESWGVAIGGLLLFLAVRPVRRAFVDSAQEVGGKTLSVMASSEGIFILAKAVTFLAITLGPVALVGVLGGVQVFYGLLFGVLLTTLFPHIFREDIDKHTLMIKVMCSLLLFAGVWAIGST